MRGYANGNDPKSIGATGKSYIAFMLESSGFELFCGWNSGDSADSTTEDIGVSCANGWVDSVVYLLI